MLFELHFLLHGSEDQLFFVRSFDVASENSLDSEYLLLLLDLLRPIKGLLKYFHGHAAANPHFSAAIDGGGAVDAAHHEFSRHN